MRSAITLLTVVIFTFVIFTFVTLVGSYGLVPQTQEVMEYIPNSTFWDVDPDGPNSPYRFIPPPEYQGLIYKYCAETSLPVDAICRLIFGESRWRFWACRTYEDSGKGSDDGLVQLNSRVLDEWSWLYNGGLPINPYDPETAIRVCTRRIAHLWKLTGSLRGAYTAWNAGETGALNPPRSTILFVNDLMR